MSDTLVKHKKTVLQHGKLNDRVYLMSLDEDDYHKIIPAINKLIKEYNYSKIFVKVPEQIKDIFIEDDYIIEAILPNYYNGKGQCLFMSKFLDKKRATPESRKELERVINIAKSKADKNQIPHLEQGMVLKKLEEKDALQITEVYKKVFQTYPFPIHDQNYIKQTMAENVIYYGIFHFGKLFALSSSELNKDYKNAEMTDFAILPEYRGANYSLLLLNTMEKVMKKNGYKLLYTIARAVSYGINITFAKLGYAYSGTLINNTNISGSIESMNVWCKSL